MRFIDDDSKPRVDVRLIDVTSDYAEDQDLKLALDKFTSLENLNLDLVLYL